MSDALTWLLEAEGNVVTAAANLDRALSAIDRSRPRMIIVDDEALVAAPSAVERLRFASDARVVVLAGRGTGLTMLRDLGADFVARKPVDVEALMAMLQNAMLGSSCSIPATTGA